MAADHDHKITQHDKDIAEIRHDISEFGNLLSSQGTQLKNVDSRLNGIAEAIQTLSTNQQNAQKPQYSLLISVFTLVLLIVGGVGSLVTNAYDDQLAKTNESVQWVYEDGKELYSNLDTVLQREMRLLDAREHTIIERLEKNQEAHVHTTGHPEQIADIARFEAELKFVRGRITRIENRLEKAQ